MWVRTRIEGGAETVRQLSQCDFTGLGHSNDDDVRDVVEQLAIGTGYKAEKTNTETWEGSNWSLVSSS
jgi:hypothetical protein